MTKLEVSGNAFKSGMFIHLRKSCGADPASPDALLSRNLLRSSNNVSLSANPDQVMDLLSLFLSVFGHQVVNRNSFPGTRSSRYVNPDFAIRKGQVQTCGSSFSNLDHLLPQGTTSKSGSSKICFFFPVFPHTETWVCTDGVPELGLLVRRVAKASLLASVLRVRFVNFVLMACAEGVAELAAELDAEPFGLGERAQHVWG